VFVHGWCYFWFAPSVSGLGRTPTTPDNREEVGAPPHWQPIPLRSIGCQCGGPLLRAGFYRQIFTLPLDVGFITRFGMNVKSHGDKDKN